MRECSLVRLRRMSHISFDALLEVHGGSQKGRERGSSRQNAVPDFPSVVRSDTAREVLQDIRSRSLEGKKWLWLLRERILEPHFVGEVLMHLAEEESALTVFKWAGKQEGYKHTLYSYNCLLGTLVRCGSPSSAYDSFCEMIDRGYTPDDYAISTLLCGFCKARRPDQAYFAVKEMAAAGIKPSVVSLNVILQSFCDVKLIGSATRMLAKMKCSILPDAESYRILIKAMFAEKRHAEVERYHQEMLGSGIQPNFATYSILVEAYCKGYRVDNAASTVKEMIDKGHKPSLETYRMLMFAYLKNWNPEGAHQMFKLLETSGYEIDGTMYQALVDGFCTAGLINDAHSLLKQMAAKGFIPSGTSYSNIIRAHCISGKIDQAFQVYEELIKAGHSPHIKTCVRLIKWLTNLDRTRDALSVYEKMIEKQLEPDQYTFHAVLWCLCRAQKILLASMLLREMSHKFKSFVPMTASYNCLLAYYCCVPVEKTSPGSKAENASLEAETETGAWRLQTDSLDLNKAMVLFDQMVRKKSQPNERTFWILICGLCKANRQVDAYKLFRRIPDFQQVPGGCLYGLLIRELCKVDKFPEAEYVFDTLVTSKDEKEMVEMEERDQSLSGMYSLIVASRARVKSRLHSSEAYQRARKQKCELPVSKPGVDWKEDDLGW